MYKSLVTPSHVIICGINAFHGIDVLTGPTCIVVDYHRNDMPLYRHNSYIAVHDEIRSDESCNVISLHSYITTHLKAN